MTEVKCISVSSEFSKLAKENHLSWSEASRIGMSILLAEQGLAEYDNGMNLVRKMRIYQKQAEDALNKLNQLEELKTLNVN